MGRHDGLSEYVSRFARSYLVQLLVKEFESKNEIGKNLEVSHATVINWLNPKKSHPSNQNLEKIIELALKMDENNCISILKKDLAHHRWLIKKTSKVLSL